MMMLIVAAVILFGPLIMGPLTPPPVFIFLIFPAVLVAIYLYLSYASKWWRTCKCVLGFCFWIMHGCTYIIGFCLSPAIKQLVYLSSLLFACFVFCLWILFLKGWTAEGFIAQSDSGQCRNGTIILLYVWIKEKRKKKKPMRRKLFVKWWYVIICENLVLLRMLIYVINIRRRF